MLGPYCILFMIIMNHYIFRTTQFFNLVLLVHTNQTPKSQIGVAHLWYDEEVASTPREYYLS
jgi:hypothetical protein